MSERGKDRCAAPSAVPGGWRTVLACIALAAAVWAVWHQTRDFEYLRYDDNLYTFESPFVVGGLTVRNVGAALSTFTQGGIWMPATSVTYMADISLSGGGPGQHHHGNVWWHCADAVLFLLLLARICAARGDGGDAGWRLPLSCLAAAAIWALHPLRNESVAWIAGRKDLVFCFWTLMGLHAWVGGESPRRTVAGWACCALACMSKPTGMVFPFVAFAVEWLCAGRFPPAGWRRGADGEVPRRRLAAQVVRYAPMLLMAAATAALASYSQTHAEGEDARRLFEGYGTAWWRLLNAAVSLGLYLAQTVVPARVHIAYRAMVGAAPHGMWLGLAVLFAACAALAVAVRRCLAAHRSGGAAPMATALLAGAFWFLASVAPTLGVAGGFGDHARADRFLYLPAMGLSAVLAVGLARLRGRQLRAAVAAALALAAAYGAAAWANARTYANDYTVFARVVECDPDHPLALAHVGSELCARFGRPDEGIECFRRALKSPHPSDDTGAQLAFALATRNAPGDAEEIKTLCAALAANPSLDQKGLATEALGIVAMREGRWADASRFLGASLNAPKRLGDPDSAMIRLAICRFRLGDLDGAEALLKPLATGSGDEKIKNKSRAMLQSLWNERMARGVGE